MKDFVKSMVNYTIVVSVPVICGGIIGAAMYSYGHEEGKKDGALTIATAMKAVLDKDETEENTEE